MKRLLAVQRVYNKDTVNTTNATGRLWEITLSIFAFIVCVGVCATPLQRWVNVPLLSQIPISRLLTRWGAWLPSNLSLLRDVQDSKITTGNGEFLLLVALLFVLYGLCGWNMHRKAKPTATDSYLLFITLIGVLIVGLIFVFTPALPSSDIFSYADYGRTILVHHSNPYFAPPLALSPNDPITRLDGWKSVGVVYGPLWLLICAFIALLSGTDPLHYLFAFRILGLLAHFLNTLLVIGILIAIGRSRRTIVLGAFLYGYNPLVLLESCLSAHNDILVGTFMLLGIWLAVRGEDKDFTRPKRYVPPLLALTMAVLIKFTAAPLLIFFIFLLICRTLYPSKAERCSLPQIVVLRWVSSGLKIACITCVLCILVMMLFYVPFWLGHSIPAILRSFSTAPSSYSAENSMMRVFLEWIKLHGLPSRLSWTYRPLYYLSRHTTWDIINIITVVVTLLLGAILLSRMPTIQSMVQATLVVLEGVLLVTPWFYSWYILWIVPLAVISLVGFDAHKNRTVILFAFVFSASAFFTYIRAYYLIPFDSWVGARYTLTYVPPLIVVLIGGIFWRKKSNDTHREGRILAMQKLLKED